MLGWVIELEVRKSVGWVFFFFLSRLKYTTYTVLTIVKGTVQ